MKGSVKILFAVVFAMYAASTSGFGQVTASISKAEEEVRKVERLWLDAYEKRDADAMNAIVADDFTITFNDGEVMTKSQVVESLKKSVTTSTFLTEDVRSRVYGDTVVLIGTVISEWKQDGKPMTHRSRYTDTYVKRKGKWQVVASHLSNAPKR